jgi:hypothetical protein
LSAQATGSSIQVMWDRGVYIGNVTDNFNISATQAGLQWSAIYDSRATYDNFSIRGSLPAWATSVTVTPSPPNVVFHEGTTLTAHAYDAVGAPITNMAFTWATSDANVFQVAPTAAATAFITAVGPGSATITATPTHGPNGSTVASVNLGTYVVYDSFSASGGTLLTAHAPEVNRPGGAWTVTGGPAPTVASQRAGVASGSSTVTATIEGWIPNVTASVLWTPAANPTGGSNYAGLVFRRSDADNYFLLRYWNGWLQLWRVCDGASTQIWASQFDEEPALQSHPIAVQLTGQQIQVLWDNALLATVTDPFNLTATQYGLQWSSLYDATSTYDNFSITGTLPPVPTRVVVTPANPAIGFNTGRWAEAHAYDAVGAEIPGVVFRWSSSAPTIVVATAQTANTGYLVGIGTGSSTITAQATRGGPIGSTTATVDLGSTLVYDSFQGSNGANLTTHVPEVAQLGGSWKVTGGNGASLSGGRAVASTTTSADIVIALFETSMPNGTLDVLWRSAASIPANAFGGVVFRATDSLNYFYLEYWGQTVQLWKRTPARFEHVAGSDVGDAGLAAHHLGATFVGATIQVKWDGVLLFTANDAFNQGATSAGLVWFPIYDPNASYDTFSVAGTLPPPVATMNVTPLQTSFAPYSTQTLTATTLDGGAQPIADAAVKFVSSDNAVATVVQTGPRTALVTAIANGSVTITTSVPRGPAPVSRTTTVSTCVDPLATPTITWDYQARTGATVAVTAPAGCSWTAFSLDSWLSVTGGAAGTGNRTVTYTFSENVGSARTGRLILGGRVYSIIQPAKPCHMDLSPDTANVGSGGGTLSFDVSTTGSCAWTAFVAQPAAWLHASSSGTGVGTITVDVDSYDNTSEPRVGAIHVGDATFVVTQNVASGACSYGVSPGSAAWGGNGGQGAIAVSASSACAWTASSNSTWVTLSATAGAGNTMLGYTVAPNLFPNVRTATLTVGTAMFVVTQNVVGTTGGSVSGDGSGGSTILVTPVIVQVPERWRSGSLALLTAAGNSWQAWSMSPWLSLDRQTGTGRATLWYKAAANPGTEDRIGTIVVTDAVDSQTVFIVQHGGSWRITKTNECLDCTDPYPPDCDPTDDGWSGGGSGDPWCEDAPEGTDDPHCNGSPRAPKVLVMQAFGNADYCVDPAPTGPPPAPHTGIFAQAHSAVALTPFEHLSLRIIPQNQTWVQLRPSYFRRDPADGLWFSTIGAGPGPNADVGRCFGTLTSDVNRDSDVNDPILFFERLQYGNGFASSIVEDVLIQDFFRRALKENGGYQNNLAYVCLPSAFAGDFTYNSNSFFAGLLDVVHIFPRPAFATSQAWRFPGFNKPVPTQWFGQ